jgi:ABC-type transport system substrate-binding protein
MEEIATGLAQHLRSFGIDMRPQVVEVATYRENLFADDLPDGDLLFHAYGQRTPDASAILQHIYGSWGESPVKHYHSDANEDRLHAQEVDRLIRRGMNSKNSREERSEAYQNAQELIYEDVTTVPLWTEVWIGAKRANLHFKAHPLEEPYWEDLRWE